MTELVVGTRKGLFLLQLYFGATSGDLFGSGDAGSTWTTLATRLPPVFSLVAI